MKRFVILLYIAIGQSLIAQVGIGTTTPDNSSILDVESDEKGILIPRMTALERIGIIAPAEGLMVFQTNDVKGFYFFDGTSWDRMLKESKDPVPTGAIFSFPLETPPTGYLVCDGSAVSRTTYAGLFAVLGTTYGAGNGSTTFNLPDYRGKFLRGYDDGAGNDPDAATRQDRGDGTTGDAVGTLQDGDMESHLHQVDPPITYSNSAGNHNHNTNVINVTTGSGGNHSHNTAPRTTNTNTTGNHAHQIRGNLGRISTSAFGDIDFQVDDMGNSGPNAFNTPAAGNHSHIVNIPALYTNTTGNHVHSVSIPSSTTTHSGNHTHSTNIAAFNSATTGSNENRPLNITVVYCIKF
ncbi:phage tail protein [Winogradskyella sp.]|jgi:microcystin-dependent protein|uniref:phage tail protein n=1 Tax=Winogradskyella sp. TaxID=1883156 RepID=UPI0025D15997|nr:phage tail protein [Winogradskyella sp.]MCT4628971.1 tail fiber protein [Winogradskyella sp.]